MRDPANRARERRREHPVQTSGIATAEQPAGMARAAGLAILSEPSRWPASVPRFRAVSVRRSWLVAREKTKR